MTLRPYQQKTIEDLYQYLASHSGDPVVVLPTGSGKSIIIAELCRHATQTWPETKILMLTHVKELIEQNYKALLRRWPNAPAGIYSAGLRRKELWNNITFGGIQSLRGKADQIGHVDLLLVDEAHLVSHKDEGGYRKLIEALRIINPPMRVIGLTATPYRLGHGLITDGSALFDDILEPVTIESLVFSGFLSRPISKATETKLSADGVHRRGGEYIESELQAAVDVDEKTQAIARDIIEAAEDRKAWLVFCAGVQHAYHMRDALESHGIRAETITGDTLMADRDRIIEEYKRGEIRALTNANVLTTGFDYPGIDLIALCRPTLSPGLYVQMVGRGMRIADGKENCLVLDFAGVVEQHGPITNVAIPRKAGSGTEQMAPVKECPQCRGLVHASLRICEQCGFEFPKPPPSEDLYRRTDAEVFENTILTLEVGYWVWSEHTGKKSGKNMIKITYYGTALSDKSITEYLVVWHDGYAGQKARDTLTQIASKAGVDLSEFDSPEELFGEMVRKRPPKEIQYKIDGQFMRIVERVWADDFEDEIPF